MPTFNFILKTKKNPANIYCRFAHGRSIDIPYPLDIYINPIHWNKKTHKIRDVVEVSNRLEINNKLMALQVHLFEQFNSGVINGETFDYNWIKTKCNLFLNRPKDEVKKVVVAEKVYYIDFAEWWLKEKAPKWRTEKNSFLDKTAIKQYKSFLEIIKKYEKHSDLRIKVAQANPDENPDLLNDVVDFMENIEKYAPQTVKRHVGRFRFFCNRFLGKERIFVTKENKYDVLEPYLNEEEINTIYNRDFSNDDELDNVRDNLIIGCWTGLRISDFNNQLNISNIKDGDYIDIRTTKTGTWTSIPMHPQIKAILKKRYGMLPRRVSDSKFNTQIKVICRICKIDNELLGKLFDSKLKRNVTGFYRKYKLVSSHICRRSFATNLYGLVPNYVIQDLGGWSTEKMMLHYIQRTKRESADILKSHWADKYNLENKNANHN